MITNSEFRKESELWGVYIGVIADETTDTYIIYAVIIKGGSRLAPPYCYMPNVRPAQRDGCRCL